MKTFTRAALVLLAAVTFVACGGDDDETVNSNADTPAGSPDDVASACMEGAEDCDDTPDATAGSDDDAVDEHAMIEEARALIGVAEDELDADVRIGRRGDEQFALTEDYVIGRMTAELDPDDAGIYRVTKIVLELTDGPMTVPES